MTGLPPCDSLLISEISLRLNMLQIPASSPLSLPLLPSTLLLCLAVSPKLDQEIGQGNGMLSICFFLDGFEVKSPQSITWKWRDLHTVLFLMIMFSSSSSAFLLAAKLVSLSAGCQFCWALFAGIKEERDHSLMFCAAWIRGAEVGSTFLLFQGSDPLVSTWHQPPCCHVVPHGHSLCQCLA